jgi:peptidoglycan hydrolase-like amidase
VFNKSKSDNPPTKWKSAVDGTTGEILKDAKTSQYSSTTGGYINNVGWDGSWPASSYEKKAGSPWFYKAWYTKGYSTSDNCGRSHPWLSEKEMADILNAWVVWRKGSSGDKSHITPVTTKCWGGDPYSLDEMADKAGNYGEEYSSVTSVDVDISNSGYTSKVTLGTNKGTISISGEEFKTVFNLRAPGYVSIKSRLFDLEKK